MWQNKNHISKERIGEEGEKMTNIKIKRVEKLLIDKIITDIKSNVGWLVNSQPTMLSEGALSTIRSILEVNLDKLSTLKKDK